MQINMKKENSPQIVTADNLQSWAENVSKMPKSSAIILFIMSLIPLIVVIVSLCNTFSWDAKIKKWQCVEGTVIQNETRRVRSGKKTRTIRNIRYKYRWQNLELTGSDVTYNKSNFPSFVKVGTKHPVIVNPDNPNESAALVKFSSKSTFVKYMDSIIFGFITLIVWIILLSTLPKGKVSVPEKLYQYLKHTDLKTVEELYKEAEKYDFQPFCQFMMPKIYYPRADYFYFKIGSGTALKIVLFLMLLQFLISAVFVPFMLIIAAGILFLLFILRNSKIIFDMEKRCILRSHELYPRAVKDKNKYELDTIKFFVLKKTVSSSKKGGIMLTWFAVTHDGRVLPITKVSIKNINTMLNNLAEILPLIGNYPLIFK